MTLRVSARCCAGDSVSAASGSAASGRKKWRSGLGWMSTSSVALAGHIRRKSSGGGVSRNLVGGAAIACLVIGCGWTVYTNIFSASVYPSLGSAGFEEPVARHVPPKHVARSAAQAVDEAFAALSKATSVVQKPAVATISPEMFNERFAAAEPDSVASNAANGAPPE